MATCAAMLGATLPPSAGVDSYDILPALVGEKRDRPIREATVLHSGGGKFAIRQGEWVLIDAASGDDNRARGEPEWFKKDRGYTPNLFPGELYDLHADLSQRRNLYGEKPEVVQPAEGAAGEVQGRWPQHARPAAAEHACLPQATVRAFLTRTHRRLNVAGKRYRDTSRAARVTSSAASFPPA